MANTPYYTKAEDDALMIALEQRIVNNELGWKGTIVVADTPTEDGIYTPTEESSDYVNAGNLSYLPSTTDEGYDVTFIKNSSTWVKNNSILSGLSDSEDIKKIGRSFFKNDRQKTGSNEQGLYRLRSTFDWSSIPSNYENCTLEIINNHNLQGTSVSLPNNVSLKFLGGKISNGTLIGNNTKIDAGLYTIFNSDLTLEGTWVIKDKVYTDWFGLDRTGATDDTLLWAKIEGFSEGKICYVSSGVYLKNRTFPKSNTTFIFSPDVIINVVNGGNNSWRLSNVDNVHFKGNGCRFVKDTSGSSANFIFEGASNCSLDNINFEGASPLKDCVYVGSGAEPSKNIKITNGSCKNALRNGISIASCFGCIIDGVEIYGTVGSPGAGIDVEANFHNEIGGIIIENCDIHDNSAFGIITVFGDDIVKRNNKVYNNGAEGIATNAGGTQFDEGVARIQDIRGVTNFDLSTGKITVSNASDIGEGGLVVGTITQWVLLNGATLPNELSSGNRYTVESVDTTTNEITLSSTLGTGEVTLFTSAGTGALNVDPFLSDIRLKCFVEGQCSNIKIENNLVYGNNKADIAAQTSVSVNIIGNRIETSNLTTISIEAKYSRNIDIIRNKIKVDLALVGSTSTALNSGVINFLNIKDNRIYDSGGRGMRVSSGGLLIDNNILIGCGRNYGVAIQVDEGHGCKITSNDIREKGDAVNLSSGIQLLSVSTVNSYISLNNVKGVASSNTTAIVSTGAGSIKLNNINWDGTLS